MAIDKVTSASITDSAVTSAKVADGVLQPNFRNIIINGDMSIAQRGTSATGKTATGYYTSDRFQTSISSAGTWTQSQSTDVPTGQGFATSLKLDCTTANGSLSSGSELVLRQMIEGQNLQYLKKGTANAESTTISFWVKSNKTGTYIVEIDDNDNSRNINKSYTISSADTWEKKTITFAGDTSGALGNDNGSSFRIMFWLAAGTDFTSGTLATSWESTTNANRAVGQVNLADSTSNDRYITGIQLEAGTSASDFEFLPVDVNLARCQRYFELITGSRSQFSRYSSAAYPNPFFFRVNKRANPTISKDEANFTLFYNNGYDTSVTWNSDIMDVEQFTIYMSSTRDYGFIGPDETKPFKADSEL